MTDELLAELVTEVKNGKSLPTDSDFHDNLLKQKIKGVWSYMKGAGVKESLLTAKDDGVISAIVLGVTDMWTEASGKAKFSQLFISQVTQLALKPELVEEV